MALTPFLYLHIHLGDARHNFSHSIRVGGLLKRLFNGQEDFLVLMKSFVITPDLILPVGNCKGVQI
jgi:hypothetical protein